MSPDPCQKIETQESSKPIAQSPDGVSSEVLGSTEADSDNPHFSPGEKSSSTLHAPRVFTLEERKRFQLRNSKRLEEFPYSLPKGATVRNYSNEENPWWLRCVAVAAILFFVLCWGLMVLAPPVCIAVFVKQGGPALSQWLRQHSKSLLKYLRQPSLLITATLTFLESCVAWALSIGTGGFGRRVLLGVARLVIDAFCRPISWYLRKCSEGSLVSRMSFAYTAFFVVNAILADMLESRVRRRRRLLDETKVDSGAQDTISTRWDQLGIVSKIFWYMRCYFPPGTGVVYEDFKSFQEAMDGRQLLLGCHPHGVVSFCLTVFAFSEGFHNLRFITAPIVYFAAPSLRLSLASARVRFGSSRKKTFKSYLENKENVALVPGGAQEGSMTQTGMERLYLRHRKGFVKCALQHGYALCPSYCFGENLVRSQVFCGALKLRHALNKREIITIFPDGLWPRRVPLLYVIGKPIQLPRIPHPTVEQVERYHSLYVSSLQKLYWRYADDYYELIYNMGKSEVSTTPPLILY